MKLSGIRQQGRRFVGRSTCRRDALACVATGDKRAWGRASSRNRARFAPANGVRARRALTDSASTSLQPTPLAPPAVIKIVGVGGGGSRIVNRLLQEPLPPGTEAWVVNTDSQELACQSSGISPVSIGTGVTSGRGTCGDAAAGQKAVQDCETKITELLSGADMVMVAAGLGGGTGSGAGPEVCRIARSLGAVTVAFATLPSAQEGRQQRLNALAARERMNDNADAAVILPHDRVMGTPAWAGKALDLQEAYQVSDRYLVKGIRGLTDVIQLPGMINVDFADVRSVVLRAGASHLAVGHASGADRAVRAANAALESPLLGLRLDAAAGVVWSIAGPADLRLTEVMAAADLIGEYVGPDADIIFGAAVKETKGDEVSVTLMATGMPEDSETCVVSRRSFTRAVWESAPKRTTVPAFLLRSLQWKRM